MNADTTKMVDAVLPKLTITHNVNPSVAADFIASAVPINGSLALKFTSNVNVDQMKCRVSGIKIVDLKRFLKSSENAPLRKHSANLPARVPRYM